MSRGVPDRQSWAQNRFQEIIIQWSLKVMVGRILNMISHHDDPIIIPGTVNKRREHMPVCIMLHG